MAKKKNNKTDSSLFHGFKNAELVYAENKAQLNFMIFLEWDENVWTYFQPHMYIALEWEKKAPMCVNIDFQVERVDNRVELVHLFNGEQFDQEIWYRANGYANAFNMEFVPFRVMDIIEEPRCSNLQMLWQDARQEIHSIHIALLNKFFHTEASPTIKKLRQAFEWSGFDPGLVNSLIFHKALIADVENNRISENTSVVRNPKFILRPEIINRKHSMDDRFTFF